MKKILLICDGEIGRHFIQRVIDTYTSDNIYYVIQTKDYKFEDASPLRFKFFQFDPTSFYKLDNILKMEFVQVVITMDDKQDVINTIKNIRLVKKHLRVVVLDHWGIKEHFEDVVVLNSQDFLASKLLDTLPNVPVIAQNVGLREGEIMEVLVPFGSSFVYKHLGVIEQKEWKIAAIYREDKLILPHRRRMIQPNDRLLLIGEPKVLKSVYKVIKQELGQFPQPFGEHIYLYIDMSELGSDDIYANINSALYIQEQLDKELVVRVVNPNDIDLLESLKDMRDERTYVDIMYDEKGILSIIENDIKYFHIGLILVDGRLFKIQQNRQILFNLKKPVLKLSGKPFDSLKDTVLLLSENRDLEKISNIVFDVAEHFELNIELYNYLQDHQEEKETVIEHYNNMASIFSKSIKVYNIEENPIKKALEMENFLQVVPFTQKITKKRIYSLFSTDTDVLYHYLDNYHQLFIPIEEI